MDNALLTEKEWEMLSPESRHNLNVFVKDVETLLSRICDLGEVLEIVDGIMNKQDDSQKNGTITYGQNYPW